jgi:hypothetical protein
MIDRFVRCARRLLVIVLGLLFLPAVAVAQDPPPPASFAISGAEIQEADGGTTLLSFRVTRSGDTSQRILVNFRTEDRTATGFPSDSGGACPAGTDFGRPQTANGSLPGPLDFAAGATERDILIIICSDNIDEEDETFDVLLLDTVPAGITITQNRATGTIRDDDSPPTLRVGSTTIDEGATGTRVMRFTITLTGVSSTDVLFNLATANGSSNPPARGGASCTAGIDYVTTSATDRRFAAGTTALTQQFDVTICGDTIDEIDETLVVNLTNPRNAAAEQSRGTGTITDDDASPTATIASVTQAEGDAQSNMVFTVRLSAASGRTVTVNYATAADTGASAATPSADATCSEHDDYLSRTGTATFTPAAANGLTPTSQTITVAICADRIHEATETFRLRIPSTTGAIIGAGTAVGTITDSDPLPRLTIGSASVIEESGSGARAALIVALLKDAQGQVIKAGRDVSFTVRTVSTSATATTDPATGGSACGTTGVDFVSVPARTEIIQKRSRFETVLFAACRDSDIERSETFQVIVENVQNAQLVSPNPTMTITNDDGPRLTISDARAVEGNEINFVVTLTGPTTRPVEVQFATANDVALNGLFATPDLCTDPNTRVTNDYLRAIRTVTFPASTARSQSQKVGVVTCSETRFEADETFFADLSFAEFAAIDDRRGVGTIANDDPCTVAGGCSTGVPGLTPPDTTVAADERLDLAYSWTVPAEAGRDWHDLTSMQLRLRAGDDIPFWMVWDEQANTFCVIDPATDTCGPAGLPGAPDALASDRAFLYLAETTVQGSGPTGPSVTLNLSLRLDPRLAGQTFDVEVAAADDLGNEDAFTKAGILRVVEESSSDMVLYLPMVQR